MKTTSAQATYESGRRWPVGLSMLWFCGVVAAGCVGKLTAPGAQPGETGAGGKGPAGAGVGGGGGGAGGGGGDVTGSAMGPEAGRLLTRDEYINSVRDILQVDLSASVDTALMLVDEPATGGGFRNDIAALLPSSVRTGDYETVANLVAGRVSWTGVLATHATCTSATDACRGGFIRDLGRLMYRRPLTDAEVANLTPLFDAAGSTEAAGFQVGARLVLEAMLQSPHFLYRLERLDSVDATSGLPGPTGFELATRLSYLVWQSAPSPALLDMANSGSLSADATLRATIQGMLAHPRALTGFQGYATDWLQLYRLDERTANPTAGVTDALLAEMKQETLRFVSRIGFTQQGDLATLFTDKKTDLGPALAAVYGVKAPAQAFATYDLSNDPNRIGILTQPGFLILRAAPDSATIVHRGLMVLRDFLCTEIPPPPPDAASKINSVPTNLTDRDRFAMHTSDPSCAGCHNVFDPLGYPFEPFDLAGRFRTMDSYGNALRSDGDFKFDGPDEPFKNTAEFATLLSNSAKVQGCLARKMYQYGAGRSLLAADEAGVASVTKQFLSGGRTYPAAILALTTSPAFRAPAPVR